MKTLYYIPIIHSGVDLGSLAPDVNRRGIAGFGEEFWTRHLATVEAFWTVIAAWCDSLDAAGMKLYQDGMVAEGEVGREIVAAGVKAGSRNYELVDRLLRRGAVLVRTEYFDLVKREHDCLLAMTRPASTTRKLIAFLKYRFIRNRLLKKRDRFIATQIDKTLIEGQTGILLIGAYHVVRPELPAAIQVREVKEIRKVRDYQRLLPYHRTHAEQFAALGRYLTAPVE